MKTAWKPSITIQHKRVTLTCAQDYVMRALALLKSEGEVLADEAEDLIKLIEKRKGEL